MAKSSKSSSISNDAMQRILEQLTISSTRESTAMNYYRIWKTFNSFIVCLDYVPNNWEQRLSLYTAYMVEKGLQSATLKSYFSAIKKILLEDGYELNIDGLLFNSLAWTCKIVNDKVRVRLPIRCHLLEILLFEIERQFHTQFYLEILY